MLILWLLVWPWIREGAMGFFGTVLGFFGFGCGISVGLVIGYYLFIYFQPVDVKVR